MSVTSSPTTPDLSGLWIPLVTPFAEGRVDHAALAALAQRLAGTGIAGFVVCGSTGEAAALDHDEQLAVFDTVARAVPDLPRVAGLSGYHLGHTAGWVRELGRLPLAGLLVPAPNYIRPSQAGLLDWFRTLADASTVPLWLYDIPYRTGAVIERETLLALAAHPNIDAIKDCGGDAGKTRALLADGRLQVFAGEDALLFETLAQGGAGAITASAHLETVRFVRLVQLLREGRLFEARAIWRELVPMIELLFAEPNPGPLKAALADAGLMQNELRAPMTRASDPLCARLRALSLR